MATTAPTMTVDPSNTQLLASGDKYRKELIVTPLIKVGDTYGDCTTRRINVRGKESVGRLFNTAQAQPSKAGYNPTKSTSIEFRTLETFMGKVTEVFDPYAYAQSIYGENLGKSAKDFDINKAVSIAVASSVGDSLVNSLFSAVRNASGSTTADLFDGFYTILSAEITDGAISAAKKNMLAIDVITQDNVLDVLQSLWTKASMRLRRAKNPIMYLPQSVRDLYDRAFAEEFGAASYNKEYNQSTLFCSGGACKLATVYDETVNAPIFITTKNNMLVGCDQISEEEKVKLREVDDPCLVQFFMMLYFGVQFERIDADALFVGKVTIVEDSTNTNNGD